MVDWEVLITDSMLEEVMPGAYARYAKPIRGALVVFLGSLPEEEQQAILGRQATLALTAGAAERLAVLAHGCPTLHKLGQTLARDHRLPADFRLRLQALESMPAPEDGLPIWQLVERELGPLDRLGIDLEPYPLAEASVALVVGFREKGGARRQGVLKILKPGIEEILERELTALCNVGAYLDEQCHELGIPYLDYEESLEAVKEKLRQEVRLDLEQRHLVAAAGIYRDAAAVQIPALMAPCTRRVTAMERITGRKVTAHAYRGDEEKRRLAEMAVGALLAKPIFAKDAQTFFHADPHAGNLFLTDDGRLGILDWSLVGLLTETERAALIQMIVAAMTLRADRVAAAAGDLAAEGADGRRLDHAGLLEVAKNQLVTVRRGTFPGITWLIATLDQAIQHAGLRVRGELMLFRKAFHALEGVLADIGATRALADWTLSREFAALFAAEWPSRWLAHPSSRAFATRLSNIDVAELMAAWPWAAAEMWWRP